MDENWNKNKLSGNSAENIIKYLIESMPNWKCNEFGIENHIRDIRNMIRNIVNPVTNKIRKMPDFIAFNEKTKETLFIEVKYRSNPSGEGYFFKYLEDYNKHWGGTKLIIVRKEKPYFVYVNLEKINNSMMKMKQIGSEWVASWNFEDLEKDIKDLFPELEDNILNDAIKLIPSIKDNEY